MLNVSSMHTKLSFTYLYLCVSAFSIQHTQAIRVDGIEKAHEQPLEWYK